MSVSKVLRAALLQVAIFGPLLFIPARTWDWWRAWVFLGVVFVASIVSMVSVFAGNEELLAERMKPPIQRGQPVLVQIGLLDPARLPVAGVETARTVIDPSRPSNELMHRR
jgi:hypothetical protein